MYNASKKRREEKRREQFFGQYILYIYKKYTREQIFMTRISGHSSIPVKLLRRSQSVKGGASLGCGGVKIYAPSTYTRKSHTIKYVVQDTSCNCCKQSFWEKACATLFAFKSIYDIVSQFFGKKKTDNTEEETPVTPQPPNGSEQNEKDDPAVENDKTYYGGMLREITINVIRGTVENGTDIDYTTDYFTGDISETAKELTEQYAAISKIEITGDEGLYQAKITYNGTDGKTVSKEVTVADTNALVTEVGKLMQELQTLDNDVGKAAQQIKQMYAGIISDIEVTQNDNGTYRAKITIPAALQRGGNTAVKEVTVSNSEELDTAVFEFTQELLTTEDNNPFKAYNNFLSEIYGENK